jgi:outer membrane protein OmpA-like peptidoglycan-associated protein/opacity protein-like surface antigen
MRKLAIAVALSSTLLATPAFARDGAWYVGGEFGGMIVEDTNVDIGAVDNALRLNYDYGYDGGLFVGYDLGAFRIEAEAAYKKADLDSFNTIIRLPGEGTNFASSREFAGGSESALSFMINGMLDFGDDDGISGFVGGGVGMARVKANNQRVFANSAPFLDDSDSRLAWQVFAGVRQAVSDNIDVTVKYRFFNVDNVRMTAFNGFESEHRFRSHSLLGGITFNFGGKVEVPYVAPPPPPPVYVPPPPEPTPPPPPPPACVAGPFMVFFDWDKDDITPQAAAILDNAASAYQTCGQAQVMIAGHADRSGSDQYNVGLSQRRAANVRSYLAGRGIPDGVMTTEAFGESRPLVETADGVREPQNRRVEITYGPGSGW